MALAMALAAAFLYFPDRNNNLGGDVFREHHGNQLELPRASGSIRTVELYPDKRTPRFGIEDHADGTTTHYYYRPDGTLEQAARFGKPDQLTGERAVLRNSLMEPDGVTYREDKEYLADGSLTKEVALQADGTTTRRYYHANGRIARDQVMERDARVWKLASESAFHADGTRQRQFLVTPGVSTVDTLYWPGEKVMAVRTHEHKASRYKEVWFDQDGETVIREVDQDWHGTKIVIKRKNGTVAEQHVWYGNVKDGSQYVTVMDEAGKKRLVQYLFVYEGELRLRSVEAYDAQGTWTDLVIFETVGPSAGNVEFEVKFEGGSWSGPHTRREYRKDGSLEVVYKKKDSNTVVSEKKFSETDNIRPAIDAEWTKRRMVTLPPQVIEFVPESE